LLPGSCLVAILPPLFQPCLFW